MATSSSTAGHNENSVQRDDDQLSLTTDPKLPSSLYWSVVLSENTKKLMEKGQGKQKCCVALGMMGDFDSRGTWEDGSMRFLHCVCKKLDQDMQSLNGTTLLTGIRAVKGWWTCDEKKLKSDTQMPVEEFEDWGSIPEDVWENARRNRIKRIQRRVSEASETFSLGNHRLQLFYHIDRIFEDKQFDAVVLNYDFDSVGWAQIRAYAQTHQIVLEDLFVKPEYRECGIGSKLLAKMEEFALSDAEFQEADNIVTVPIPREDVWKTDKYQAVKKFFVTNGYVWKYENAIQSVDYAAFSAEKKTDLAQEGVAEKSENLPRSSSPVLPVMRFTRPVSEANITRYLTLSPIVTVSLAYGNRGNIQVTESEGKRFLTGVRFEIYDGVQIYEVACPRRPRLSSELSKSDMLSRMTFR